MSDAERVTFSSPLKPGYLGRPLPTRRTSPISVIALIVGIKGVGLLITIVLATATIISQTHPEIINVQSYMGGGGNNRPESNSVLTNPTALLQTQVALLQTETVQTTPINSAPTQKTNEVESTEVLALPTQTSTVLVETATSFLTDTPAPSATPTQTLPPTATLTQTPTVTLTFTPSPTIYPYSLTTYNGLMSTPLQGIGFGELGTIISQVYSVPDPLKDLGHHGVDLGSYDYHGKLIYDWPVLAVFSGKVAGVVTNRPPIGNTVIIEASYDQLPAEVIKIAGIKPGQSLYHMYSHMLYPPKQKIGDVITVGQVIGAVGKSQTVEAHLHLEMVIASPGHTLPSMAYYNANVTEEEKQAYLYWRTSGEFVPFDPMIIFANLK